MPHERTASTLFLCDRDWDFPACQIVLIHGHPSRFRILTPWYSMRSRVDLDTRFKQLPLEVENWVECYCIYISNSHAVVRR